MMNCESILIIHSFGSIEGNLDPSKKVLQPKVPILPSF